MRARLHVKNATTRIDSHDGLAQHPKLNHRRMEIMVLVHQAFGDTLSIHKAPVPIKSSMVTKILDLLESLTMVVVASLTLNHRRNNIAHQAVHLGVASRIHAKLLLRLAPQR